MRNSRLVRAEIISVAIDVRKGCLLAMLRCHLERIYSNGVYHNGVHEEKTTFNLFDWPSKTLYFAFLTTYSWYYFYRGLINLGQEKVSVTTLLASSCRLLASCKFTKFSSNVLIEVARELHPFIYIDIVHAYLLGSVQFTKHKIHIFLLIMYIRGSFQSMYEFT